MIFRHHAPRPTEVFSFWKPVRAQASARALLDDVLYRVAASQSGRWCGNWCARKRSNAETYFACRGSFRRWRRKKVVSARNFPILSAKVWAKIRSNELRGQRSAPTSCGGKDLLHELRCKDSLHELRGKSPRLALVLADEQLTAVMCDTALALLRDAASRARSHQLHLLRVNDRLAIEAGFARGSDLQKCPAARCCGGAVAVLLG